MTVSDVMVERALTKYNELRGDEVNEHDAMRHALESIEGNIEQKIANEQVRQMNKTGVCPNCGSETGG
jgi:hypothetical protein